MFHFLNAWVIMYAGSVFSSSLFSSCLLVHLRFVTQRMTKPSMTVRDSANDKANVTDPSHDPARSVDHSNWVVVPGAITTT